MLFEDTYLTIKLPAEGIYRAGGSRFVSYAFPVTAETDLKPMLNQVKALHPAATHYCWAVRLGSDQSAHRFNDDGEPAGSAGRPIINSILSKQLNNIMIVVVRYFGGTLLGIPGLISAYKAAAEDAIANAAIIESTFNDVYKIDFSHLQMNAVMKLVKDNNLKILIQSFEETNMLTIAIRKTLVDRVVNSLQKLEGISTAFLYSN